VAGVDGPVWGSSSQVDVVLHVLSTIETSRRKYFLLGMGSVVPPLHLQLPNLLEGQHSPASVLLWASGCAVNARNLENLKRCIRFFKRRRFEEGQTIFNRGALGRYISLILSGECLYGTTRLACGNWIGLNECKYEYSQQLEIIAGSPEVILLCISHSDFRLRIPRDITVNLESRVRAVSRISLCSFNKAVAINQSVMTNQRDPKATQTARLLSGDVLVMRSKRTYLEDALSTTRSRIHDLQSARA
jgi:CRP-like cAMP-binding protein